MEQKLRTLSKNHSDRDGDWVPEFDDGTDTLRIIVPDGKKYARLVLDKDCFLGDCRVISAPRNGATGNLQFKVRWNYASFGKANYDLKVYVADEQDANEPLLILFGSHNWEEIARGAINSGKRVKVKVSGPQALLLYPLIWGGRSRDLLNSDNQFTREKTNSTGTELKSREAAVAITAIICFSVASVIIFAALAAVIMHATQKGKCASANTGGSNISTDGFGFPSIEIDIHDCAGRELMIPGLNEEETEEDNDNDIDLDEVQGEEGYYASIIQTIEKLKTQVENLKKKTALE